MENVKGFVNFLFRNAPGTPEVARKKERIAVELGERVQKNLAEGMDEKRALEVAIDEFEDLFSYVLEEGEAVSQDALEEDQPLFPEPEASEGADDEVQPEALSEDEPEEAALEEEEASASREEDLQEASEEETWGDDTEEKDWIIPDFDPRSISSPSGYLGEEEGRKVRQYKLWLAVSAITTPVVIGLVVLMYFLLPHIPFIAKNTVKYADIVGLCASVGFLLAWPLIQYVLYAMSEEENDSPVESPGKDIIYSFTSWLILVMIFYLFNYVLTTRNYSNVVWWPYCVVASFAYPLASIVRMILLATGKFYRD